MAERWRDALVLFLVVACAVGTYATAQAAGISEPLPAFLPLLCAAAFVAYRGASGLLGKSAAAPPFAEFSFPVYVLRNPTGLILCTEEPDGGYLAVFTGPVTAARFREVRSVPDWSPAAFSRAELLDALQSARRSGRVQFVMIDPMVGQYGLTPVFPLSDCIERLSE